MAAPDIDPDPDHVEYSAPSGDLWRIEDAEALINEFRLGGPEALPAWHAAMAGQGRIWTVVCRYFGVAEVLADADKAAAWEPDRIAKELGIKAVDVENEVDAAVAWWNQQQMVSSIAEQAAAESAAADAGKDLRGEAHGATLAWQQAMGLEDEQIDRLLTAHGFDDLDEASERRYIAGRLIEFDNLLVEAGSRILVTTTLRQELDLSYLNRELTELRAKDKTGNSKRTEITGLIDKRDKLLKSLKEALQALGETQGQKPSAQRRVEFQDCLGGLTRAAMQYYENGDKRLIDGMMTAAEVEFALQPIAERPPSYDPQMVMEVFHAQQHLWEPQFKGYRLPREQSRRLRAAFKEAIAIRNEEHGLVSRSLEDERDEDAEELAEELAKSAEASPVSAGESVADGLPSVEDASAAAQLNQARRTARRREENDYVAGG